MSLPLHLTASSSKRPVLARGGHSGNGEMTNVDYLGLPKRPNGYGRQINRM
ncbi:hypothetical protein [Paraburkholderia kirstenboschensis]|uniref:hypothetical protein n=1 Tax=Paraburkholderia kirstenboschensis TaxID=1245436 RepID=UPI000AD23DF3|nr:hypothetical protein [Paraburkholderia kirstenboschensis]